MRVLLSRLTYRLWLFFGGDRVERGFRFLSDSIIENRQLINELSSKQRALERRVWELEGHATEETLAEINRKVSEWADIIPLEERT